MNRFRRAAVNLFSILFITFFAVACGSSSSSSSSGGDSTADSQRSGDGGSVELEGTLRFVSALGRVLGPGEGGVAGISVSALGDNAVTDENGNFNLSTGSDFTGGPVLFTFIGSDFTQEVILEGVPGGGGLVFVDFILELNGTITGELTDTAGNLLGTTPGARLGCSSTGTFVDGPFGGSLWKPHSERTGTVVILMPPQYASAGVSIVNTRNEEVTSPLIRDCCSHNGGREHIYLANSAESLLGVGTPLTVVFTFPDGFVDCRVVDVPTQRYD